MNAGEELERTIDEYRGIFVEGVQDRVSTKDFQWDHLQAKLCDIGDWTTEGAEEVTRLAREYGGFILRNALAVAKVLNIEDGELGY
jgi:hypothetical protein